MRKDASVSLQQLRACLRAHERLLDEDWPETAWSSASESDDEEENPRQAYRRLNPPAGDPLKERNVAPLWSTESSEVLVAPDPPPHHEKEVHFSDVPQMDGEHWADVAGAPLHQPVHHVASASAPYQHEHTAPTGPGVDVKLQDHYEGPHATLRPVDGMVASQKLEPRHFRMQHSTAPARKPMPALPSEYTKPQSALACVNVKSRNPSPDLISEPEIYQLDDDINSVKALLQEREKVLQPVDAGRSWHTNYSSQQSPSISPSTSLYQKSTRPKVPHHRVTVARPGMAAHARGRTARARTVSPLRQGPHNLGVHTYGLTPTESTMAQPPAGSLRQGEAMRLQGKLQSAELRAVGLGETIKVLEASLKVKDDTIARLEGIVSEKQAALIQAKQRTPTKQPKPVTPTKTAPNLKHLMASRKLEKDLKKRISDLQEDLATARAALSAEKERSSALGESVRRAQQARREVEQERVRAASAADLAQQKVSGLATRVKTLQRQVEEEQRARLDAEGELKAVKLDLERERAQRTDATNELSRCAPRVQELQIALSDYRREAEEKDAQLNEAKEQIQSLGGALRETRKDNSRMKAALTSTQQGVKAMHSIIQQQHRVASTGAPSATFSEPQTGFDSSAKHGPSHGGSHLQNHRTPASNVSATAAAAAAAATAWNSAIDNHEPTVAVDSMPSSTQPVNNDEHNQLNTFPMSLNRAGAAPSSVGTAQNQAWGQAASSTVSHAHKQQQSQQIFDMGNGSSAHNAMGAPSSTTAPSLRSGTGFKAHQPIVTGQWSLDQMNGNNTSLGSHSTDDRGGLTTGPSFDAWEGVHKANRARSESADSDQLSFDQEVQDIIHRGALITSETS